MDFKAVLSLLLKKFDGNNVNYALMGGFALGLCGVGRTTLKQYFYLFDMQDLYKKLIEEKNG